MGGLLSHCTYTRLTGCRCAFWRIRLSQNSLICFNVPVIWQIAGPFPYIKQNVWFQGGIYALKKINSTKFKMPHLRPLLSLIRVISGNPCLLVQVGMHPEQIQHDRIQNSQLLAIISINMPIADLLIQNKTCDFTGGYSLTD